MAPVTITFTIENYIKLVIHILPPNHAQIIFNIYHKIDFKVLIRTSRNFTALDMLNVSDFLSGMGSTSTNQRAGIGLEKVA